MDDKDKSLRGKLEGLFSDLPAATQPESAPGTSPAQAPRALGTTQAGEASAIFRAVAERTLDAVAISDLTERLIYCNHACYALFGYDETRQELANIPADALWPDEQKHWLTSEVLPLAKAGEWRGEAMQRRKDGSFFSATLYLFPVHDEQGQCIGRATIIRDLAAHDPAELETVRLALADSQKRFREWFDEAPFGYHEIDNHGYIVRVNRTELEMLGYTADEMLGRPAWEFFKESEVSHQAIMAKLAGQVPQRPVERALVRKDSRLVNVLLQDRYLMGADGKINGIRTILQDISDRKRVEETLEQLRRQYQLILDSVDEGILGLDADGKHTFVNPAAARLLGYTVEELVGRPSHATLHHTRADGSPYPAEECYVHDTFTAGALHRVDNEVFWKKDGTCFPVEYSTTPVREGDRLTGAVVTFRDMTERRQAEARLGRESNLLRTLIDNLPDTIYAKDTQSRMLLVNKAQVLLLGAQTSDDLLGKSDMDFFPPELAEKYLADERALFESGQPFLSIEEPTVDPQGNRKWLITTKVLVRDSQGKVYGLVGIGRDITERKVAEAERERLLQDIQARAERDQLISAMVTRVRAGLTVDQVLAATVEEIGVALGAARVAVRLHPASSTDQGDGKG